MRAAPELLLRCCPVTGKPVRTNCAPHAGRRGCRAALAAALLAALPACCRCSRSALDLGPPVRGRGGDLAKFHPVLAHVIDTDVLPDTHLRPGCDSITEVKGLGFEGLKCSDDCGYLAEVNFKVIPGGCHFTCVQKDECGAVNTDPLGTIPDGELGICRRCSLPGCKSCRPGNLDICEPSGCRAGYFWNEATSMCKSMGQDVFTGLKFFLLGIGIVLLIWYVDLRFLRPAVNEEGLQHGLRFRDATKLVKENEEGSGQLYPLSTNLQSTANADVAGPGTILYFNFQMAIIIWSGSVALIWYVIAKCTEEELLILGLRPAVTPAQFCGVVHWGHRLQYRMMWAKVLFLAVVYVFTFVGTIMYSAVQIHRFTRMDDQASMKDFAAVVYNLPVMSGSDLEAESETKAFLEKHTGQRVIGVSLCWNFVKFADTVATAVQADLQETEAAQEADAQQAWTREDLRSTRVDGNGGSGGMPSEFPRAAAKKTRVGNCCRRGLARIDNILFNLCGGGAEERNDMCMPQGRESLKEMLCSLQTTGVAFAVFETEAGRDRAVAACKAVGGFAAEGACGPGRVVLRHKQAEPESVIFSNFGVPWTRRLFNMVAGVLLMLLSQAVWGVVFYLPYAYYVAAFTYAHGDEPDTFASLVFTTLVVIGNQLMYYICYSISDSAGYWFVDSQQSFYTVLYLCTMLINITVDLGITSFLAYRQMVGLGVHTVDGRLLKNLDSIHDIFEAFSMQKSLGDMLWMYNFPSLFLIPFLIEPVVMILLFRHLMILLVRAHGDMSLQQAEQALQIFAPMDMGRYSDIVLNVTLAVCAFSCAPGWYLKTFAALCASHVYILLYDHYRVLRCVPGFSISTDSIERISQSMLCLPCGLILMAVVFKGNCMDGAKEPLCVRDGDLAVRMIGAFALHMVVFLSIHSWLLPWCIRTFDHETARETYEMVARRLPCSWFSSNPVHCLRSKLLHKHTRPCKFYVRGKEHLLCADPSIGCYFQGKPRADLLPKPS